MTGPHGFGPDRRLPDRTAFDRVFSGPDFRFRRHPFMLLARRRGEGCSRIGFVVGKKHARSAVTRNLIRRLARERFRQTDFAEPVDVILMARPGAAEFDRDQLGATLTRLLERLHSEVAARASLEPASGTTPVTNGEATSESDDSATGSSGQEQEKRG